MPVPEDILTNAGIRDYLTHAANSHREVDANEILKVIEDQSFDVHLDEYSSSWDSRDPNRVNEIASIAEQRVEVLGKRYDSHVDMISDLVGRYDLFPDTKMGDIRFLDEIDHLLDQISKGKKSLISREALKKENSQNFCC